MESSLAYFLHCVDLVKTTRSCTAKYSTKSTMAFSPFFFSFSFYFMQRHMCAYAGKRSSVDFLFPIKILQATWKAYIVWLLLLLFLLCLCLRIDQLFSFDKAGFYHLTRPFSFLWCMTYLCAPTHIRHAFIIWHHRQHQKIFGLYVFCCSR